MAPVPTGTNIRFLTSGFQCLAKKIVLNIGRERYIATQFSTTVAEVWNAKSVYDLSSIDVEIFFSPNKAASIPILKPTEIIQIVYPVALNSLWSFNGFVESFNFGISVEELMSGMLKIKGSGPITYFDRLPLYNTDNNIVFNTDGDTCYAA